MAFISVLILNLALWVLVGILILGVVFSVACIGMTLRNRKRRREGNGGLPNNARDQVLATLFGVLAIADFFVLGFVAAGSLRPKTVCIETAVGEKTVLQSTVYDFENAIAANDAELTTLMLEQKPELADIISFEGYSPLGAAIRYDAIDVAAYLLKAGVDVDRVDRGGTESSVSLLCRMSSDSARKTDMLNLLLDYGADVNSTANAMPPVQSVLQLICEDGELSESDLALFERFLDRGANLRAANGRDEDSAAYFERISKEKGLLERQPEETKAVRELLNKQNC